MHEDAPRIHVQRFEEPAADRLRHRDAQQHVAQPAEVFRISKRAPGKHRDSHQGSLRDIDATIEMRPARRRRHGNPQILPVPFGCEPELLDSRAEHVIGNAHLSVGEDDALGRNGTMRQIAGLAVERVQARRVFL